MSIKIMHEAWQVKGITPTAKLILMCLADHANEQDRTCWPAISLIADKCDVSRSTVKRHLIELQELGLIAKRSRTGDSTLFFILPEHADEQTSDLAALAGKPLLKGPEGRVNLNRVQFEPGSQVNRGVGHSYEPGGGSLLNHKPSMNHQLTITLLVDEAFEELWKTYPRRKGSNPKKPALLKFKQAIKAGAKPEEIISGAKAYHSQQLELGKVGTEYVAQLVTWLNQERWRDMEAGASDKPPQPFKSWWEYWQANPDKRPQASQAGA